MCILLQYSQQCSHACCSYAQLMGCHICSYWLVLAGVVHSYRFCSYSGDLRAGSVCSARAPDFIAHAALGLVARKRWRDYHMTLFIRALDLR